MVCYCANLPQLPTKTRVVLLQHPRERDNAIGTARMASLCLPNSELHVGIDWSQKPAVHAALANESAPAVLLYPGPEAKDILQDPPKGPVTLVVVDGTWSQAKTVVRDNPLLATLPRYAFRAPAPSEYRIRREPSEEVVSTIESLMYALGALEGDAQAFTALMRPFRSMVDAQLGYKEGRRKRLRRRLPKHIPPSPELLLLRERWRDLVCVVGEANAWPYQLGRHRERDELVHWMAQRPSTGERFVGLALPTHAWSPSTEKNLRLPQEAFAGATSRAGLYAAFSAFRRPADVLCTWGRHTLRLYRSGGGELDGIELDIRTLLAEHLRRRVPTLEAFAAERGLPLASPDGRAGYRLTSLVAAVCLLGGAGEPGHVDMM